jgi:hypothetical protein
MSANSKCPVCDDKGWVCKAHPDRPFRMFSFRADACECGGAGTPCRVCNPANLAHSPDSEASEVEAKAPELLR